MTAKTLNELQDALDEGLSWRRIELFALTAEIERHDKQSATSPLARALARSGLAMLYAHWEGYTKEACQHYVDYVVARRPKIGELSDGFAITAMRDLARRELRGDPSGKRVSLDRP